MNTHPTRNQSPVRLLLAVLTLFALAVSVPAEAGRWRHKDEYRGHGKYRDHGRHRNPGRAYHPVRVGRHRYFYRAGRFFRHHPRRGYFAVRAPIGAVIANLPAGFQIVLSGGTRYFHFGNVYYLPHHRGFRVVAAPVIDRHGPRLGWNDHRARWNDSPPADSRHLPDRNWITVAVEVLNVRSGPGKNHPVIGKVRQGRRLEVHDRSPGWSYVELPHGRRGWVMDRFTTGVARRPRG
jgi:uncharacterized protein YgiM (DUF1202 family)